MLHATNCLLKHLNKKQVQHVILMYCYCDLYEFFSLKKNNLYSFNNYQKKSKNFLIIEGNIYNKFFSKGIIKFSRGLSFIFFF